MIRRKGRPGYWFQVKQGGRRVTRFLGTDYQEALLCLRSLKGQDIPLTEITIREAAKRWVATYVATMRNPKGRVLAERRVDRHLNPRLGHYLLSRVTSEHLRSYRLSLESAGLAPLTVSHLLSDVRCVLRWCEDTGLVARSPFPRRLLPRVQERPPDRLSTEEEAIIRALPEPHGFVCRLGLETGLRWSEMCRARAEHVERGFLVVAQTKSGRVRRVPLTQEFLAELRTRIGKLIPYADSAPGSFGRTVKRLSGISGFHAHQLRHTFSCAWLEQGGSLAALQQVLGHASIVTTQRYARLSDESVMAERARMEQRTTERATKQT